MKNLLGFLLICSVIFFSACQKEISLNDPIINTGQGTFRAKIDGVQWEATSIKTASIQDDVIVVYGLTFNNKSILLRVADSGVHNYVFDNQSMTNVGVLSDSTENPASYTTNQWDTDSTYGNMNVTSIDTVNKTISGTFSMHVYRQLDSMEHDITEGVFTNISYVTQPPAPSGTDSFRVKVDGLDFTYTMLIGIKTFGMISVSASTGVAPATGITVPEDVVPGTYDFDIATYVGQYNPSSTVFLAADTGSITILEHNTVSKRIRGNFHFLANTPFTNQPPNVQLTEGYFSVVYQ